MTALSSDDWVQIHLISDLHLYPEAEQFISSYGPIEAQRQMNGLLNFARSRDELLAFVYHQAHERDWESRPETAHYGRFYREIERALAAIERRFSPRFIAAELDEAQIRQRESVVFQALAQLFVEHLAAENLIRFEERKQRRR